MAEMAHGIVVVIVQPQAITPKVRVTKWILVDVVFVAPFGTEQITEDTLEDPVSRSNRKPAGMKRKRTAMTTTPTSDAATIPTTVPAPGPLLPPLLEAA
jgi:hypothetical protein